MGEHTTCHGLREEIADFLRLHADHIPTLEDRDALSLKALRMEVEEATEAPGAISAYDAWVARVNLGEIENIWLRTNDQSIRENATALLRKNAAYAAYRSFIA